MNEENSPNAHKWPNNGPLSPSSSQKGSRRKRTGHMFTYSVGKENSANDYTVLEKHNHNINGSSDLGNKRQPLGQLSQTSSSKGNKRQPLGQMSQTSASKVLDERFFPANMNSQSRSSGLGLDEIFSHDNKNSQSQNNHDSSSLIYSSVTTQLTYSLKEGHVIHESSSGPLSPSSAPKGHKRICPGPLSPSSAPKALSTKTLQSSEQSKLFSQRSLDENADPNVSASIKNGFQRHASNPAVTTTPSQRRLNLFDLTPQSGLTHINSSANPYSPKQSASSEWFPRNEEGTCASRLNLMDAFNNASDVVLEDMPEYEQYVTDDELDATESQGEYSSDCNDEYIDEDLDFWKGYMDLGPP
ncbi:uncharacterized protein LOC141686801 isoform X2 [Apium graveolens]|uniref:uncharacterized protein LOC141686801 isoform X2 n=1 Tax=Apium graveolens TaxID=4045 RepID=UPI003D7B7827